MRVFLSKKNKILLIILLILGSIFSTTSSLLNWYLTSLTPVINILVKNKLEKITYEIITDKINTDLINESNLRDVLIITKNADGEILTVDYNLEKAYTVNNMINNSVRNSITNLEVGDFANSEFLLAEDSVYINVPMFINSNLAILASLGPKIPVKINFIGTIITNLKTKITSYGLNNVLNEIYVSIEIHELITTPVSEEAIIINYDILIDATMINGRVPTFYGNEITAESNILDIPLSE